MPRMHGFTLLELLIAMTIAAILAALAYPSFQGSLHKARRGDGVAALLHLQMRQERWRSHHPRYAATLGELGVAPQSGQRHYTVDITQAHATGYVLVATAAGWQDNDLRCRELRLEVAGGEQRRASFAADGQANTATDNRACWGT